MSFDLATAWFLIILAITGSILYVVRVLNRGRHNYDRIDRQGGSKLLNKDVMTMGYWWFEPLGKWLVKHGVSANTVSWTALVFGILAAVAVSQGLFGVAGLFALMSGLLDIVDGMVARMSGKNNPAGEVLDSSLDRYVDFFFLAGLVIYYQDSTFLMTIVMFAMLGSFMVSYSTAKAEAMQITPPRGSMKRTERVVYLIGASILAPLSISYIEQSWSFAKPLALPMLLVVCLIAVMANVSAIQRLKALAQAVTEKNQVQAENKT